MTDDSLSAQQSIYPYPHKTGDKYADPISPLSTEGKMATVNSSATTTSSDTDDRSRPKKPELYYEIQLSSGGVHKGSASFGVRMSTAAL